MLGNRGIVSVLWAEAAVVHVLGASGMYGRGFVDVINHLFYNH